MGISKHNANFFSALLTSNQLPSPYGADRSHFCCATQTARTRAEISVSSCVDVHRFSEMTGSSCWAETITSQSQLDPSRGIRRAVIGTWRAASLTELPSESGSSQKWQWERQPAGSAKEPWNGKLNSLHGASFCWRLLWQGCHSQSGFTRVNLESKE